MEPKEKIAFEPTGLVPRSIVRTFERFRQQLLPGSEGAAIREYRISRYQVLVSTRCLFTLLTIPIATNWFVSSWLLSPIIEHFWNTQQNEIFLNAYQEERAFTEMESFSEKLFFESLLIDDNLITTTIDNSLESLSYPHGVCKPRESVEEGVKLPVYFQLPLHQISTPSGFAPVSILPSGKRMGYTNQDAKLGLYTPCFATLLPLFPSMQSNADVNHYVSPSIWCSLMSSPMKGSWFPWWTPYESAESALQIASAPHTQQLEEPTGKTQLRIKQRVQDKILELAVYYNQQTISSITNVAGDIISALTLACLFVWMKPEISILKSFLVEAIYSLSDTTKSFLLILLTDLLVGFHSPRGWETALEVLLKHFGLPENQDFVFLFVATFPVLLDTVFKYWIFRHLNKISPSTVATYHSMIE